MDNIRFNVSPYTGKEAEHIDRVIRSGKLCGDGEYTKKCDQWIEERTGTAGAYRAWPDAFPFPWRSVTC